MTVKSFDLDRVVKWAIVALCAVLIVDVSVRQIRELTAEPASRPDARRAPAERPDVPLPTELIALDQSAYKGRVDAPVVILGYSDFQCPYCSVFARDILPVLEAELIKTGRARFVLKHLPLDTLHPQARRLASAAECARQLGRFWEFHDLAFLRQRELATLDPVDLGREAGLGGSELSGCIDAGVASAAVVRDSDEANRVGVSGTPTFFVGRVQEDGRLKVFKRLVGAQPVDAFKTAVTEVADQSQ